MPSSSIGLKSFSLVIIAHFSFTSAQPSYSLDNSLDFGSTLDTKTFPPFDGFNKDSLFVADDTTTPPLSGEPRFSSEVYSQNGQDPESSLMQISNIDTNKDGCRALGPLIDMLPSYTKKLLKRQGQFCTSPFLNHAPNTATEAGKQQQGAPPAEAIQDRITPSGAGFGGGKLPGQGQKRPGNDKKNAPSRNDNRKLAPPELNPEKEKCGNSGFTTYLVCGPLIGASPSLLDSTSLLLAGANPCMSTTLLIYLSYLVSPPPTKTERNLASCSNKPRLGRNKKN